MQETPGSIPGLCRSAGEGIGYPLQYSWASLVAQLVKNPPAMSETWVWSLGWEDPLEKGNATHSRVLAWRIPWTVVHGITKRQTGLSDFHFQPKPQTETRRTEGICASERWHKAKCFHIMIRFVFPRCSIPRPLVELVCFLLSENISNFSLLTCLSKSTPIEID